MFKVMNWKRLFFQLLFGVHFYVKSIPEVLRARLLASMKRVRCP